MLHRLVVILILCIGSPALAYGEDESPMSAGLGARAGLGWTTLFRAEGTPGVATINYQTGLSFGLSSYLDVQASARWLLGVQLDASWIQKGRKVELDGVDYGKDRFQYLDIPVLIRPALRVLEPLRIHATAGPRIGFLLGAEQVEINGSKEDLSDFYDRIDVGLSVGAGLLVDIGSRTVLSLEARYDQGLTNVNDASENPGIRHRSIFFTLGVDWELWRKAPAAHAAAPR